MTLVTFVQLKGGKEGKAMQPSKQSHDGACGCSMMPQQEHITAHIWKKALHGNKCLPMHGLLLSTHHLNKMYY